MDTISTSASSAASPSGVLAALRQEAEHKAHLRLFYAAADIYRDYHGPFAAETKAERERHVAEYEARAVQAEHERHEHKLHPTPASHRVCSRCHAEMPANFAFCGNCGHDLGSVLAVVSDRKRAHPLPTTPAFTRVTGARPLGATRRKRDNTTALLLVVGLAAIVALWALVSHGRNRIAPQSAPATSR